MARVGQVPPRRRSSLFKDLRLEALLQTAVGDRFHFRDKSGGPAVTKSVRPATGQSPIASRGTPQNDQFVGHKGVATVI